MYKVYILKCSDNTLYTGITTDLEKRLKQHNGELLGGAKYTLSRKPVQLLYSEESENRSTATKREMEIKKFSREKKIGLIEFGKKINWMKDEIKKYFGGKDIIFNNVNHGRTNINFFVNVGKKEYFIRTGLTKVNDPLFGGFLEKESKLFKILGEKGVSPKLIHSEINGKNNFLIIEKINGEEINNLEDGLLKIKKTLHNFQKINISDFNFINKLSLFENYKEIINTRIKKIKNPELLDNNLLMYNYLFNSEKFSFDEEFCLVHNDFRLDNLIFKEKKTYLIDLEGISIGDKYLDLAEFYVGGIFWDTFKDINELNFSEFSEIMTRFGYKNTKKQKFIFILKFLSNYSWLTSYISQNNKPEEIYKESLERNNILFNENIIELIN